MARVALVTGGFSEFFEPPSDPFDEPGRLDDPSRTVRDDAGLEGGETLCRTLTEHFGGRGMSVDADPGASGPA